MVSIFFVCRGFSEGLPQQPAQHVRSGQSCNRCMTILILSAKTEDFIMNKGFRGVSWILTGLMEFLPQRILTSKTGNFNGLTIKKM
jgi:hypothetical protein